MRTHPPATARLDIGLLDWKAATMRRRDVFRLVLIFENPRKMDYMRNVRTHDSQPEIGAIELRLEPFS